MSREKLPLPFSFLNRDALDALYGSSPDGIMVECFDTPLEQTALSACTPPLELPNIAEIVYVNPSFQQLVHDAGVVLDDSNMPAIRGAMLNLFDAEFQSRWRTRAGIYIDNVPLAAHATRAEKQPRDKPSLMLSATPITHEGSVYGCCVRITDATPALSRNAEEHRALRQIEAFVLTENVPLVCLEFATPLPSQVSSGELGAAYLASTITHITASAAQQFDTTPAELLRQPVADTNNPGIALITHAFPETNHGELQNLGDTTELLVPTDTSAGAGSVYRITPTFVFENGYAVEAWLRIEDETSKRRRVQEQKKLDRTRALALEGAALYQFELERETMQIHADSKGLDAMGFTNRSGNLDDWLARIEPDDVSMSREQLLRQISSAKQRVNAIVRLRNNAGEYRHVQFWGETAPPDDASKPSTRILGLFRDVTQSEKLSARLRDKKTLESLGVLAGGVAHDFNNMLMSVLGYAELTEADMLEAPQRDRSPVVVSALENVREIRAAALRASELCTSLLAYAGQHLIEKKSLDLAELVRTTAELVQLTIGKQAPLVWELDREIMISADQGQLTQVIVNLMGNAADAMQDREGVVHVSIDTVVLTAAEQAQLEEPISEPGETVACLTVRDTGTGMSQETLQRMYEPFFTTKSEGRGLGMAAVHGIVKHHGGGILVNTVEEEGTEFRVCFPLAQRTPTAEQTLASEPTLGTNKRPNVLVVDDETSVRRIAAELLRHLQCEVQEAESAEAALALFDRFQFDYVLLDITMPVMSGNELAEILLQRNPDLSVVLCSGFTEKNVPESLLRRCTFIHKPFTLQEVREALNF